MEFEAFMTIIISGLGAILLAYFTSWFKTGADIHVRLDELEDLVSVEKSVSQAKEEGRIEARQENNERIAELEKSLANAKNSSEFSYWKRKGDSEKLEKLFNLLYEGTFDLEKIVKDNINSINELIIFIKQSDETDLMTIHKNANLECSRRPISPRALLYSTVFYNLYFLKYNDRRTNQSLNKWSQISNRFKAANDKKYSMSARFTKQGTKENAIQFLERICTDINEHYFEEMGAIHSAKDDVLIALTSLSEAVYSD